MKAPPRLQESFHELTGISGKITRLCEGIPRKGSLYRRLFAFRRHVNQRKGCAMKKEDEETLDILICILGLLTFSLYSLIKGLWKAFHKEEDESPYHAERDLCNEEKPQVDQRVGAFFIRM